MYCCYNSCSYLFLWLIIKMTKKLWLFIFSFIAILSAWISFSDLIIDNVHYVERCVKITNPHWIPWYKLIIRRGEFSYGDISYSVYDVVENKCLPQYPHWWSTRSVEIPYLVDENIDVSILNEDKVKINSIKEPSFFFEDKLWNYIKFNQIHPNWYYIDDSNPLKSEIITYKIVKNWNNYELEEFEHKEEDIPEDDRLVENWNDYTLEIIKTKQWIELVSADRLVKFWIAWIITILIETIVLFVIAKLFRKENQISNLRFSLVWILASTITLPLLRFILPLFITGKVRYMIIWELSVTLLEIFIIKYWLKITWKKAIIASIICNLCSYLFWLFIF